MGAGSYCSDLHLTDTGCSILGLQIKMNTDLFFHLCSHLIHHFTVQTFRHGICLTRDHIHFDPGIKRYQSWQCFRRGKVCGKMAIQSAFFHICYRESSVRRKGHRSFFFNLVVVVNIRASTFFIRSQDQTCILR